MRPSEHREDIGSEVVAILVEPAAGGVNDLPRVMAHHELGLGRRATAPSLSLSRGGACGGGHARCSTLGTVLRLAVRGEGGKALVHLLDIRLLGALGACLLIEQRHDTQPAVQRESCSEFSGSDRTACDALCDILGALRRHECGDELRLQLLVGEIDAQLLGELCQILKAEDVEQADEPLAVTSTAAAAALASAAAAGAGKSMTAIRSLSRRISHSKKSA